MAVTLFEQQPALCMRSVSGEVSQRLEALHREQGVEIRTGCGALELEDDGGLPVIHCDGQRETFDAVVVGIGVDLNLELARDAGLKTGRGSWWMPVDARRIRSSCRRRCRPAPSLRAVHPVPGLRPESGGGDGESDAQPGCAVLRRRAVAVVGSIPAQYSDPWYSAAGSRTVVREEALYFSLDDNGRLTQLVAFDDARTVKLAKRWMAAGRDLSDVPLADPTFSLMSLR